MPAAQTAFTGHLMHAQPFSDAQAFCTPLYRKWTALRKSDPGATPSWETFQALASQPKTPAPTKSKPAPGQLSKRGQKLVEWQDYGPGKSTRAKAARTGAPA